MVVDCSPRDGSEPDYDLGFHCHQQATKSCLKLWGLSQFNPILGSYDKTEIIHDEFFDETTNLAINARRYIEIFDDKTLADQLVGKGDEQFLRFWDALGTIIHGQSFVAGYHAPPSSPTVEAIRELFSSYPDGKLDELGQQRHQELNSQVEAEGPMRWNIRLVGYTISTDRKKDQWISVERMSHVFLEQEFSKLAKWQQSAPDFRTPIEE
jgi:hypothetical protein